MPFRAENATSRPGRWVTTNPATFRVRVLRAFKRSPFDHDIIGLALPALGALAADPLVSLIDTAFVGRLGTNALASLGVAVAVFGVFFALFNFLAYGTTPLLGRALGAGDSVGAGRIAASAMAMAVVLGEYTI